MQNANEKRIGKNLLNIFWFLPHNHKQLENFFITKIIYLEKTFCRKYLSKKYFI